MSDLRKGDRINRIQDLAYSGGRSRRETLRLLCAAGMSFSQAARVAAQAKSAAATQATNRQSLEATQAAIAKACPAAPTPWDVRPPYGLCSRQTIQKLQHIVWSFITVSNI